MEDRAKEALEEATEETVEAEPKTPENVFQTKQFEQWLRSHFRSHARVSVSFALGILRTDQSLDALKEKLELGNNFRTQLRKAIERLGVPGELFHKGATSYDDSRRDAVRAFIENKYTDDPTPIARRSATGGNSGSPEDLNIEYLALLTPEEEQELFGRIKVLREKIRNATGAEKFRSNLKRTVRENKGGKYGQDIQEAANELEGLYEHAVRHNMRLVASIARTYSTNKSMDRSDLMQLGLIGLARAIDTFDPDKGFKFSTYATWWIKQSIRGAFKTDRRTVRYPAGVENNIRKVRNAKHELKGRGIANPSIEEIAEEADIKIGHAEQALDLMSRTTASMSAVMGDGEGSEFGALIEDESINDPVTDAIGREEQARAKDFVRRALLSLKEREQIILIHRLGLLGENEKSLEAVAEMITPKVTRERVRQIQYKAQSKLARRIRLLLREEELGSMEADMSDMPEMSNGTAGRAATNGTAGDRSDITRLTPAFDQTASAEETVEEGPFSSQQFKDWFRGHFRPHATKNVKTCLDLLRTDKDIKLIFREYGSGAAANLRRALTKNFGVPEHLVAKGKTSYSDEHRPAVREFILQQYCKALGLNPDSLVAKAEAGLDDVAEPEANGTSSLTAAASSAFPASTPNLERLRVTLTEIFKGSSLDGKVKINDLSFEYDGDPDDDDGQLYVRIPVSDLDLDLDLD